MTKFEAYFYTFRENIIGINKNFTNPYGKKKIVYADWAASGRLYRPIEKFLMNEVGPYVANTHSEATLTGSIMTNLYHQASKIIKQHVNANNNDVLIYSGFGMTSAINKLQRILGLRIPEKYKNILMPTNRNNKALVILTHMEHHSNQTSWIECLCDVEIIKRDKSGLPDLNHLENILRINRDRKQIIGSFTACSNVTGIVTSYQEMAEIMHNYERLCFIDFAASAPYVKINMHPENEKKGLDAVFFSPHKFLGGPGASGVLIFNKSLYKNEIPDHPGGGTVSWTNPWGGRKYFDNIEIREDGGTPGFLQAIKASLAILLKEKMGIKNILLREHQLKNHMMDRLQSFNNMKILDGHIRKRLGFISFFVKGIHHNLIVRLLNDRYGVQTRGGCSCAGTYGHILLNINEFESKRITDLIDSGDLSVKPGWTRISLHPTMRDNEIDYIADSIEDIIYNRKELSRDYSPEEKKGDYRLHREKLLKINLVNAIN